MSQTLCFNMFWNFLESRWSTRVADTKNGLPQVDAKELSRQSHKTLFFRRILLILIFGIHLVAAPSVPFMWKVI